MLASHRRMWMVGLCLLLATRVAARSEQSATAARHELESVDQVFITAYGHSIKEILSDTPPTFLVLGDKVVLYRQGERQERPLIPPVFDELKTIAHIALGVFATISPVNGGALGATQRADLHRLRASLA